MLTTVDLDDQLSFYAGEVDDVRTHWHLAAETVSADLFSSQSPPETYFGVGHLGSQPPAALNVGIFCQAPTLPSLHAGFWGA